MPSPLIKPIATRGGTFYTFTSANRDIINSFNQTDVKFNFSKFALLKIPPIKSAGLNENSIRLGAIHGAYTLNNHTNPNINKSFAEHFQNYILNFEYLLLKNNKNTKKITKSPAERVFFKWLKETGAIRFNTAGELANAPNKFIEEPEVESYQRVVKYLGDIKLINNVKNPNNSFSQINIYVATRDGHTPLVLFNSISDDSYKSASVITGDSEFISGRTGIEPNGLVSSAFYDYDSIIDDSDLSNSQNFKWFAPREIANSYFTELVFGQSTNKRRLLHLNDFENLPQNIDYLRTDLDGICIDWNSFNYTTVTQNPHVRTIQETNALPQSKNFDFNAVLVYYDIFNPANPAEVETNLYGVLFLDDFKSQGAAGWSINTYPKWKPDEITKLNGNGFSLNLNIKFDANFDSVTNEVIINDYSAYSMELYAEALLEIQRAADLLNQHVIQYNTLKQDVNSLKLNLLNFSRLKTIENRLNFLEQSFSESNMLISGAQQVFDLIDVVNTKIQSIIDGKLITELQYNTDVLRTGPGIKFNKQDGKTIQIINSNQYYNATYIYDNNNPVITTFNNQNELRLSQFTTAVLITNSFEISENSITFLIDDSINRWQNGQVVEFYFKIPPIIDKNYKNLYNIIFKTNKQGVNDVIPYGKIIDIITGEFIYQNKNAFKLKIICTNAQNLEFQTFKEYLI
jgi:hypothetical protein